MKTLTVQELIDILMTADPSSEVNVQKYACGKTFTDPLLEEEVAINEMGMVTLLMDYN